MPPANLSDQQAHQIVAYLRSLAAAYDTPGANKADLAHGKALFESKGCLNCHRVRDHGSRVGPDLTNIGARRKRDEIERSIVDPNAEILPENRYVRVVTRDGATITGRILNEDTFSLQLIDSKEKLVSLQKADLSKFEFLKNSADAFVSRQTERRRTVGPGRLPGFLERTLKLPCFAPRLR